MPANESLRAAREAAGYSRDGLAERVSHRADRPFDANHLGKIERGVVSRPGRAVRDALCAVLDATEADLGLTPSESQSRVSAALQAGADRAAVDTVADVLASLRHLEDETTAADVLPSVRTQAALAERLADSAPGSLRAHAVGLVSELEQYLGWLAIPTERWSDARRHLDAAAARALEANDPPRLAQALSFSAYRAMLRNDIRSAAALADAAGRETRVDPGLRAYMTIQRAEVAAYDDDRDTAVALLSTADGMLDDLPPSEELPSSSYWYVPSVLLGHKGFVLRALGDHAAARRAATDSLAAMPATWRDSEWAAQHRAVADA